MHRGGTSVLARALISLGFDLGRKLMIPVTDQNARGFWEDVEVATLNDRIFAELGRTWHSVDLIEENEWESQGIERYRDAAISLIEQRVEEMPAWGIKDPRMTRLLPFWKSVFRKVNTRVSYVVALRNPLSVVRSLVARNGFTPEKSLVLWLEHMLTAMAIGGAESIPAVIDYDLMLFQPGKQLRRLAQALDISWETVNQEAVMEFTNDFLANELRHSHNFPEDLFADPAVDSLVKNVYSDLLVCAGDESNSAKTPKWQHYWTRLQDRKALLEYLEKLEANALLRHMESTSTQKERGSVESTESTPERQTLILEQRENGLDVAEKISVVIPLFNHARYIEAAIESVLKQTVPVQEIIIVDDGSTDDSRQRIEDLAKSHSQIVHWTQPNRGAHSALNAGIHRATGDFVAILNSDDYYAPERLAICLQCFREKPHIQAVSTGLSVVSAAGENIYSNWYEQALHNFRSGDDTWLALLNANFIVTSSNLVVRRDVFDRIGFFAPFRYAHDLEYAFRLLATDNPIEFIDQSLLCYRVHGENTIAENVARVDLERALIASFYLCRRFRSGKAGYVSNNWISTAVETFERQRISELVEFLAAQQGGHPHNDDTTYAELQIYLAQRGAGIAGRRLPDGLLSELVQARAVQRESGANSAKVATLKAHVYATSEALTWAQRRNEELELWIQSTESAKQWLSAQVVDQTARADDLANSAEELKHWIAELEDSKKWLSAEVVAQKARADELVSSVEELKRWMAELENGKAWLANQNQLLEQEINGLKHELNQSKLSHAVENDRLIDELGKMRAWAATIRQSLPGKALIKSGLITLPPNT